MDAFTDKEWDTYILAKVRPFFWVTDEQTNVNLTFSYTLAAPPLAALVGSRYRGADALYTSEQVHELEQEGELYEGARRCRRFGWGRGAGLNQTTIFGLTKTN